MRAAIGIIAIFFATSAFAQGDAPKASKRPATQAKPAAAMGCKLVGSVRGTKIWAGDCVDGAQLRGAAPLAETQSLPAAAAGAIPPGQKE